jgi:hypothetical protein
MQVLGHSQISLTLGTYSQVVPELAHAAADRMGAALWGAEATTVAPDNRRRRSLRDEPAAEGQWGGWGSNPRPAVMSTLQAPPLTCDETPGRCTDLRKRCSTLVNVSRC